MVAITNPPPDGLVAVAVGRRVTLSQLPHSLIIMYIILLFLPHPTHLILLFVLPSFCGQTSSFPPNTFVSLFLFTPFLCFLTLSIIVCFKFTAFLGYILLLAFEKNSALPGSKRQAINYNYCVCKYKLKIQSMTIDRTMFFCGRGRCLYNLRHSSMNKRGLASIIIIRWFEVTDITLKLRRHSLVIWNDKTIKTFNSVNKHMCVHTAC